MLNTRRNATSLLFVSVMFSLYRTLYFFGAVSMPSLCIKFALYLAIFTPVCLFAYKALVFVLPKIHCVKIETIIYEKWRNQTYFLIIWLMLAAAWTPAYLAFFPGIFGYDAPNQMQQILGELPYMAHHPLMHTAILGLFMNCGKAVFGTYNGGVALFCIFQGIIITGSIAYTFLFMKRFKTPFPILVISLLWCALNPVLQILTFNTTKDILFGAFLLHFIINCYEQRHTRSLIFSGILMCLLRNQGIYIVIALLIISVFVNRNKKFLISLFVIAAFSQLFFSVTNNISGVLKGDAREMLSVPMQQMALVCSLYMEGVSVNLTQEEFEKFSFLVDKEYIPGYHFSTADPIKTYFNTVHLKQDMPGYLFLYIRMGMHNSGYYMTALRGLIYPYWDMSENPARDLSFKNTFPEFSESWGIYQQSLLPGYKQYLCDYISYEMDKQIPVLSWLLQPGLCIWLITALIGLAIAQKNTSAFIAAITAMLFFGTLMLGPIALMRYIYPLTIMTPWFLGVTVNKL